MNEVLRFASQVQFGESAIPGEGGENLQQFSGILALFYSCKVFPRFCAVETFPWKDLFSFSFCPLNRKANDLFWSKYFVAQAIWFLNKYITVAL